VEAYADLDFLEPIENIPETSTKDHRFADLDADLRFSGNTLN
jgi:hypothetical protein